MTTLSCLLTRFKSKTHPAHRLQPSKKCQKLQRLGQKLPKWCLIQPSSPQARTCRERQWSQPPVWARRAPGKKWTPTIARKRHPCASTTKITIQQSTAIRMRVLRHRRRTRLWTVIGDTTQPWGKTIIRRMEAVPNRWPKRRIIHPSNCRKLSIIRDLWPRSRKKSHQRTLIKLTKAVFSQKLWVLETQMQARGRKYKAKTCWQEGHPLPTLRRCARCPITHPLPTKFQTLRPTLPTHWPPPPKTCNNRTTEAQSPDCHRPNAPRISIQCPDGVVVAYRWQIHILVWVWSSRVLRWSGASRSAILRGGSANWPYSRSKRITQCKKVEKSRKKWSLSPKMPWASRISDRKNWGLRMNMQWPELAITKIDFWPSGTSHILSVNRIKWSTNAGCKMIAL